MKNNNSHNPKTETIKRLVAIMVAVVFMLGTTYVPAMTFAADETGAAGTDQTQTQIQADEQTAADEQTQTETQPVSGTSVTGKEDDGTSSDMEDLLQVQDGSGKEINIEDLDKDEYDGFLYKLEDDTTKTEIHEMKNEIDDLDKDKEVDEIIKNEVYAADSVETIDDVATPDMVEYIEPNYAVTAAAVPNDPYYASDGWALDMMNVPEVWDENMFGKGVTVAVLDSGVPSHEDIDSSHFVDQVNYSSASSIYDDYGHATGVIGTIAATYNNGIGLTGAMPDVSIMPVKVLDDEGNGWTSDIAEGIEYSISKKADVINMSLGSYADSQTLKTACEEASVAGILVVAAAGNEALETTDDGVTNPVEYPAAYDCVVSVASVDSDEDHSSFSTYNDYVTVAAPGQNVCVPISSRSYSIESGTSFSAPAVSALAAMVKSINSDVDTDEFMSILKETSRDKGESGYDQYYGYGIIDFAEVYSYMMRDISAMHVYLSSNSYTYNGGVKTPSVTIKLANKTLVQGTDYTLSYSAGRADVGTYGVTATAVPSEQGGTYTGSKTVKFVINPTLVKSIRKPAAGKKKLKVRWYSMSKSQKEKYKTSISGYQVRVARNNSFSGAKYKSISGYYKTSKTVTGLAKKKKYYIQYRAYKTVDGKTYYSKWSSVRVKWTR